MASSNGQPTVSAERCPKRRRNDQADHPDADQQDLPAALPCGVGQGAHDKTWRMPYSHGGFRGEGVKAGWYSPPFPRGSTLAHRTPHTAHRTPHTAHLARLRPRWLGFAIAFYTW